MTTFKTAVLTQETKTENGAKAFLATGSKNLDLFGKIGSARNFDLTDLFLQAYSENNDIASRILLWARDVRGGAGERKTFRNLLNSLCIIDPEQAKKVIRKIPEVGRWDDLLSVDEKMLPFAFDMIRSELLMGEPSLCAKWMPRKGMMAVKLRNHLGLTPKQYRKTLVMLSDTVEQDMCAKTWSNINYSHVPSLAASRYQKAFTKNDFERYSEWKNKLQKGQAKVNAGALYPYDVLKSVYLGDELVSQKQWESLPDYMNDADILPIVDVSGSMICKATESLSCLDIAVSLGLYISEKNKGKFKKLVCAFSSESKIVELSGSLRQRHREIMSMPWGMSTNLNKAFENILKIAKDGCVPQHEMPKILLIMSDMQFDSCVELSGHEMMKNRYLEAGYEIPKVVFWNLNAQYKNVPVKMTDESVALVSGFSPSIMKSVLSANRFDPLSIMLDTIMIERYDLD